MAAIAEFYSDNLGQEVRKGMQQKLRNGGWPHLAPVGYLNVRITLRQLPLNPSAGDCSRDRRA